MVSLLDLPGEIRNQIYNLCLVSPNSAIVPVSRREAYELGFQRSCSHSGPFFYLLVDNTNPSKGQSNNPYPSDTKSLPTISHSLPRTCRQIYKETNNLFWTSNTFYFSSPHYLRRTFDAMGIYPTRRITSVRLLLTPELGNHIEWFDKAMQVLAKQGQDSSIRHLELMIHIDSIEHMAASKNPFHFDRQFSRWNEKFLPSLCQVHRLQNTERILCITHPDEIATAKEVHEYFVAKNLEKALRDMHKSWGGKLYWGSTIVLDDAKEILLETSNNAPLDGNVGFEDVEMES